MPIYHIATDWNGTLFQDVDETNLWKHIAYGAIADALQAGLAGAITFNSAKIYRNIQRLRELKRAKYEIESLIQTYKCYEVEYDKIYEVFNQGVLRGMSELDIRQHVSTYSRKQKTKAKIDRRLVDPILDACKDGITLSIISTGLLDEAASRRNGGQASPFNFKM